MMIIFSSSSISSAILTEAGEYKKSSAANELWIPVARLHWHRLRPDKDCHHQVDDTETLGHGGDDGDAKENHYGEDNDDKDGDDVENDDVTSVKLQATASTSSSKLKEWDKVANILIV